MLLFLLIYEDTSVSFCWIAPILTFTWCWRPPICTLCSNFSGTVENCYHGWFTSELVQTRTYLGLFKKLSPQYTRSHLSMYIITRGLILFHQAVGPYVSSTTHGTNHPSWPTMLRCGMCLIQGIQWSQSCSTPFKGSAYFPASIWCNIIVGQSEKPCWRRSV